MNFSELLAEYPPVLDVEDVGKILRIGRAAAYRAMNDPNLGAIKIGGSLRVTKTNLVKYLEKSSS
ncbi:helix-turn-helix domain-containing protein [Paenibacillus sp. GYB004]|uniref:helix-turn-helix domain-containing protein n=1 Tax=Paenibacillus sp. GYB004 TaxID=2994393 RepID=UPI002F963214